MHKYSMTKDAIRKRVARAISPNNGKTYSMSKKAIAARVKRAKDPIKYREQSRIAARQYYNNCLRTGYPRGRPRFGEVRPPSKNAMILAAWRERAGEAYRKYNREYQRMWAANNPERTREIKKGALLRKKAWRGQ